MTRRFFVGRTKSGAFVAGKAEHETEAMSLLQGHHSKEPMEGAEIFWGPPTRPLNVANPSGWNQNQQLIFTKGGPIV